MSNKAWKRALTGKAGGARLSLVAVLMAIAMPLAGCGDDSAGTDADDTDTAQESVSTAPTESPEASPPAEAQETEASSTPEPPEPTFPTAFNLPNDICTLFDQAAVESVIGVSVEAIALGPDDVPGVTPKGWICLLKQVGGDDQAPGWTVQVQEGETEASIRQGFENKEVVVGSTCEEIPPVGGFNGAVECIGGLGGPDARALNLWSLIAGTSVTCGANYPGMELEQLADLCLSQVSKLG